MRIPILLRAIAAFLALPGLVAFAVPFLLADAGETPFRAVGLVALVPGAGLLVWCVREFVVAGRGTLAPWDPPRRLVTSGPYRVSRNPMYVAVALVIAGWAVAFQSGVLAIYGTLVAALFHLRVVRYEEPQLARAFRDDWTRYAARVPRWLGRTGRPARVAPVRWTAGRAIGAGGVLVVLAAIAGLVYEAIAEGREAREFPAPGTLVDIGGRRLHLVCLGEGEPIVLFESSGWGTSLSASAARERIAGRTRVCSYDRRGRGWSDPAPGPASAVALANDLGVLQDRANLDGPFVLVAASIGGLTTEIFARQYPERVAGLVFVDAANSLMLPFFTARAGTLTAAACAGSVLAPLGVVRLLNPFRLSEDTEEGRRGAALAYNARTWSHLCAMARGVRETARAFEDAPPLPDVPLVVLSASSAEGLLPPALESRAAGLYQPFVDAQRQFAQASPRGTWEIVPDSPHLIAERQPDAVANAVLGIVADVRARRPRDPR